MNVLKKYQDYEAVIREELLKAERPINYTDVARIVIARTGIDTTPELFRKTVVVVAKPLVDKLVKEEDVKTGARILFFDIETAPHQGYFWNLFPDRIGTGMVKRKSYMLSWSAKWLNDDQVINDAIINHRTPAGAEYEPEDSLEIVKSLREVLNKADIVIGHNIDRYDIKYFNTYALKHGLKPPSPYNTVDTLKVAKHKFKFPSNRLDDLAEYVGCRRKIKHSGFDLWVQCMEGDPQSWPLMVEYCDNDVLVVEEVYHKLLPYISNHPNVALYDIHAGAACSKCGSEDLVNTDKYKVTKVAKYELFYCGNCFSWGALRPNVVDIKERATITKAV